MAEKVLQPHESPTPLMSLAAAEARGIDVTKVRTCAVPQKNGDNFAVKGCPHAEKCALRMFGQVEHGGFGPKSARPGSPGEGPKYVGYYRYESSSNTEKEDLIPCYGFMVALFDMYEQQNNTGDKIEIVAQEGETITQLQVLPEAPGSNSNFRMVETPVEVKIPAFANGVKTSRSMAYADKMRENRKRLMTARRRQEYSGDDEPEVHADAEAEVEAAAGPVEGGGKRGSRRG